MQRAFRSTFVQTVLFQFLFDEPIASFKWIPRRLLWLTCYTITYAVWDILTLQLQQSTKGWRSTSEIDEWLFWHQIQCSGHGYVNKSYPKSSIPVFSCPKKLRSYIYGVISPKFTLSCQILISCSFGLINVLRSKIRGGRRLAEIYGKPHANIVLIFCYPNILFWYSGFGYQIVGVI